MASSIDTLSVQSLSSTVSQSDLSEPIPESTYKNGWNDGGIAISGMACRLPGDCSSPEKLGEFLSKKRNAYSQVPEDRFSLKGFFSPIHERPGSLDTAGGCFLNEDIRNFDPSFFGISPNEALSMDPQQRKALEISYECLESAGITLDEVSGRKIGCFVGNFTSDYAGMQFKDPDTSTVMPYMLTGLGNTILSNRISYAFNLCGPSLTLDTACSSSIYALQLACQSLLDGSCDGAIVLGTNLILSVDQFMASAKLGVLSPTSKCHTFDASADGYARAEAVSAIYITRLQDAVEGRNPVRAVIRGCAFNSNGRTPGGMTNPRSEAQESVIREAYKNAGIEDFQSTGYFECHGTGTAVGDPLEINAIGRIFGPEKDRDSPLLIGSVKSNLGHSEAASGITSIIKCVLALEKGVISPTIGLESLNPNVNLLDGKLKVVTENTAWPASAGEIRRAALNSFGYGGANACVVLDAAEQTSKIQGQEDPVAKSKYLLAFSAHDENSLKQNIDAIKEKVHELSIHDLAYTLGSRRSKMYQRGYAVVDTRKELAYQLNENSISFGKKQSNQHQSVAFVFTGQGAQWPRMGIELFAEFPLFAATIKHLDEVLKALPSGERPTWTIEDALGASEKTSRINDAQYSQPLCTAIQLGLVELLRSWNIRPAAVVGHSSGEIAAAYAAGRLTMDDAIKVAYYRGFCTSSLKSNTGAMLAVGIDPETMQKGLSAVQGNVNIACYNSQRSVTLSGDVAAIDQVKAHLDGMGVFARALKTSGKAYHSPQMESIGEAYESCLRQTLDGTGYLYEDKPEMFSSVTTQAIQDCNLPISYWRDNLESPVRFQQAVTSLLTSPDLSVGYLIELGPHSALAGPLRDIREALASKDAHDIWYTSALVRGKDAVVTVLALAGSLFVRGLPINLAATNSYSSGGDPGEGKTLVNLPPYQWNYSKTYWYETRMSREYRLREHPRHDILGSRLPGSSMSQPVWRNNLRLKDLPWLRDHQIGDSVVFPATGYIAMAVEALTQKLELAGVHIDGSFCLRNIAIKTALRISESSSDIETMFYLKPMTINNKRESDKSFKFEVHSLVDGIWSSNCTGAISLRPASREALEKEQISTPSRLLPSANSARWYQQFQEVGLNYGATFKQLEAIRASLESSEASAIAPSDPTKGLMSAESRYVFHPCTLDLCLQTAFIAVHGGVVWNMQNCYLPVAIEEVTIFQKPKSGNVLIDTKAEKSGLRSFLAQTKIRTEEGTPIAQISDLKFISVDAGASTLSSWRSPFLKLCWKPDIDVLGQGDPFQLFQNCNAESLENQLSTSNDIQTVGTLIVATVLGEVLESDCGSHVGSRRVWTWMKQTLEAITGRDFPLVHKSTLSNLSVETSLEIIGRALTRLAVDTAVRDFVQGLGPAIRRLLRSGKGTSSNSQWSVMAKSLIQDAYNTEVSANIRVFVDLLAHKNPTRKILQVGGAPATTGAILRTLDRGGRMFRGYNTFTVAAENSNDLECYREEFQDYQGLKIDLWHPEATSNSIEQTQQYDLIVLDGYSKSQEEISENIRRLSSSLAPEGQLLLCMRLSNNIVAELVERVLTDGSNDVLLHSEIHRSLEKNGLKNIVEVPSPPSLLGSASIFLASKPNEAPLATAPETCIPKEGTALVYYHAKSESLSRILQEMEAAGLNASSVSLTEFRHLEPQPSNAILLLETDDRAFLHSMNEDEFKELQYLIDSCSIVLWLSSHDVITGEQPEQSLTHGLMRTIANEKKSLRSSVVNISPAEFRNPHSSVYKVIVQRYFNLCNNRTTQRLEREIAIVNGLQYVPRVAGAGKINRCFNKATIQDTEAVRFDAERATILAMEQVGQFDKFIFKDDPLYATALEPNDVELKVSAAGVSFKDVTIAAGIFDMEGMGWEYTGHVSRVGSNVTHLRPGDRALTLARGNFNRFIRTTSALCFKVNASSSLEEMATMPIVYSTAIYGLIHSARLSKGEKVLIHSAAGGLGIAAIQIAKMLGAEIFATVGTASKRQFLSSEFGIPDSHIMNSRDDSFVSEILSVTGGRGVDVVLCSVSGELLQDSFRCLHTCGRLVEVGRSDVYEHGSLDLAALRKNVALHSFDMSLLLLQVPDLLSKLLGEMMELYESGRISPIKPIDTFHITEIGQAMRRFMQRSGGGKTVLTYGPLLAPKLIKAKYNRETISLNPDAAYLLVGCLGGLGRSLSTWMVNHGATELIFLSRSGSSNAASAALVNDLQSSGITATVISGTVTSAEDVSRAIESSDRPIKGVVHAPMVLQDGLFSSMSLSSFQAATMPKVAGALNLHNQLEKHNQTVDFFVMTSSVSAFVGNLTQSNYAAGNSFQDAFARYRRNKGLAASSIALGVIEEVGYVSERADIAAALGRFGCTTLNEREFLFAMEQAMLNHGKEAHAGDLKSAYDDGQDAYTLSGLEPERLASMINTVGSRLQNDPRYDALNAALDEFISTTGKKLVEDGGEDPAALLRAAVMQGGKAGLSALEQALASQLTTILMLDEGELDEDKPLADLGVDSMAGTELRNWIFETFNVQITFLEILQPGLTVAGLAAKSLEKMVVG